MTSILKPEKAFIKQAIEQGRQSFKYKKDKKPKKYFFSKPQKQSR